EIRLRGSVECGQVVGHWRGRYDGPGREVQRGGSTEGLPPRRAALSGRAVVASGRAVLEACQLGVPGLDLAAFGGELLVLSAGDPTAEVGQVELMRHHGDDGRCKTHAPAAVAFALGRHVDALD